MMAGRWNSTARWILSLLVTGGRKTKDSRCSGRGGLVKERSRRKLEMWRNFGYGGFGSYGEELAKRAGEREQLQAPFMANRGRRRRGGRGVDGSEAGGELGKKGVVDLATSPAGKTGKALRRTAHGGEELREASASIPRTVRHREKRE